MARKGLLSALTTSQQDISATVYRCEQDGRVVLVIPSDEPIPAETETVRCPDGHLVTVPKYRGRLASAVAQE